MPESLSEHDRVELIRGEVITMSPIGPPHSAIVDRITRAMVRAAGDEAIVRVQSNVELSEYNEPEPDIVLMRPRDDFYYSALPAPADIFLIVEVSDSSIRYDRGLKAELYAETGIPEYWVVDVKNRRVFAYADPQGQEYRVVREFELGGCRVAETAAELRCFDCVDGGIAPSPSWPGGVDATSRKISRSFL